MELQYDLFEEMESVNVLANQVRDVRTELGNTRRGLFARHNEMARKLVEVLLELEMLKLELAKVKR